MRSRLAAAATLLLVAACSSTSDQLGEAAPTSDSRSAAGTSTLSEPSSVADTSATSGETVVDSAAPADDGMVVVNAASAGTPLPRSLFGVNVPAWITAYALSIEPMLPRIQALGAPTIRMPGGSWSSSYSWLGCERGNEDCYWPWAQKPSDFITLMDNMDAAGIWTVSINATAQEAAALVAFFRGSIDDDRPIGTDRYGVDWSTVSTWARLRTERGHPEPAPVMEYEIGNEVYGAKPDAGPNCASFGWEDAWTCDGSEYVTGNDEHDGFLDIATAMKAVDPDIRIGLVGTASPDDWTAFGREALDAAGDAADFYIVHDYPFTASPSVEDVATAAEERWPGIADAVEEVAGRSIEVAVTEFNLVAFLDGDGEATMSSALSMLFYADSLGQMASSGIDAASFWNLANGRGSTGADYGLIHENDITRAPAYYALALWTRMGSTLLPADVGFDDDELTAYASRADDGTVRLIVVNKSANELPITFRLDGAHPTGATMDAAVADDATAETVEFNGSADPPDDLSGPASTTLEVSGNDVDATIAPWSITLVTVTV